MKKFKFISILAGTIIAFSAMSGCVGGGDSNAVKEDPNTVPSDPYEISWYFQGDALKDKEVVENAINDYLKDKINATVKLNRFDTGSYQQKMQNMINAGEAFDIAFTANWGLVFRTNAINGAWYNLDPDLDTYMPQTKALFAPDTLDNARVDGKLYAIPANKELARSHGWAYREDLAQKYNLDMSQYKSFEELIPVLEMIKANEPDFEYPLDVATDRTAMMFESTFEVSSPATIFYTKYDNKVVNVIETIEFEKSLQTMRKLYEKRLIKQDVLTAKDFDTRLKEGKTFVYGEFLKPGKVEEVAKNFNYKLSQVEITPIYKDNMAGVGSMMAISRTSRNPQRAMRFLELFNNDKELNNLVIYGIEGKHYTKIDENTVDVPTNTAYTLAGYQWMMGNVFINYLTKGENPDKNELLKKFNEEAIIPPVYGFVYDPLPMESIASACKVIREKYNKPLVLGAIENPMEVLAQYRKEMKDAGVDKIIEEAQRQYDEFLAKKGSN